MSMIFFTFRSQTGARRGLERLKKQGISAKLGKTPGALAVHGCGYGIWVPEGRSAEGARTLREQGAPYEKSYRFIAGEAREVNL